MRVLGVDPGGKGALALLTDRGLKLSVHDMPVLKVTRGRGTRSELDVHALLSLVSEMEPDVCYFERVHGMDGDGAASAFNFGDIYGACRALCAVSGARLVRVAPHVWKKDMGLIGKQKDDSRMKAMDLWPSEAAMFRRKMDDGRADAALIAEHGRRQLVTQGVFG